MPQIRPITDLRKTTEISNACHAMREPMFITKNGYGDLVIMSMETYEEMLFMTDVYSKLAEAETAIAEGKTSDARQGLAELREKYGL
jgi:PHD/YefM family antitoxin component YafN of YafNO toxin-antitoxin module